MMSKTKILFTACLLLTCSLMHAQIQQVASVGDFIPDETAQRWTKNFNTKFPDVKASHIIDKNMLTAMLSSPEVHGVYFYNALSNDGSATIIPMACDAETALMSTPAVATESFQDKFPTRSHAQLVGKDILKELISLEGTNAIVVINVLNDDNQEKLVLMAVDKNNKQLGDDVDATIPCPPYCPKVKGRPTLVSARE